MWKRDSYIRGQCGGDYQPNGRDGTPTRETIPLKAREGNFVTRDGRINPK